MGRNGLQLRVKSILLTVVHAKGIACEQHPCDKGRQQARSASQHTNVFLIRCKQLLTGMPTTLNGAPCEESNMLAKQSIAPEQSRHVQVEMPKQQQSSLAVLILRHMALICHILGDKHSTLSKA